MNKIIYMPVLLATLVISLNASAAGSNGKDKTFRHSFHHAKNVHRFEKANGFTEYDFMIKGRYIAAFYDATGTLVETDISIAYKELPPKVVTFINAEFPTLAITDITKVKYKQNTFYKIRLESGNKEYKIVSTEAGEITMGYE